MHLGDGIYPVAVSKDGSSFSVSSAHFPRNLMHWNNVRYPLLLLHFSHCSVTKVAVCFVFSRHNHELQNKTRNVN